ncbi:amidoligase family protein [Limnobacter parvus]|uniref:Amidoligase family protein n=1 Tax=Limnobacter parvus TaxID=2939690 RepID=A0ABT1XGX3_9BURK|nr:amidoligase family protein [Limnobacter parvus]MCR2745532.1 amidoligase family protein [Limnobacter parvus]
MHSKYAKTAWPLNEKGEPRTVGFELEFAGLDLKTASNALANALSGEIELDTQAECKVRHPQFGHFKIELDWSFAKNMARRRLQEQGASEDMVMSLMTDLARQIVPLEIVCPPIPVSDLQVLDIMVESLQKAGALGTSDSLIYAFGVHINAELPAFDSETLVAYIQAYCLAQNWLIKAHEVDPVRRLTPYIDSYPKRYVQAVMAYTEAVSVSQIIDDYLEHNPTRNRGMDLLPLFKYIDDARVSAAVTDERVNARPTFHYRLPNCEIENPDWELSHCWNIWCVVEHLAADPVLLTSMCKQWTVYNDNLINLKEEPWHQELAHIYENLLSV